MAITIESPGSSSAWCKKIWPFDCCRMGCNAVQSHPMRHTCPPAHWQGLEFFTTPRPEFAFPFNRRDRSRPRSHHRSRGEHDSERHAASPPPNAPPPASVEEKEAPKKLSIVGDAIKLLQMQLQQQATTVQTVSPQELALRRASRL